MTDYFSKEEVEKAASVEEAEEGRMVITDSKGVSDLVEEAQASLDQAKKDTDNINLYDTSEAAELMDLAQQEFEEAERVEDEAKDTLDLAEKEVNDLNEMPKDAERTAEANAALDQARKDLEEMKMELEEKRKQLEEVVELNRTDEELGRNDEELDRNDEDLNQKEEELNQKDEKPTQKDEKPTQEDQNPTEWEKLNEKYQELKKQKSEKLRFKYDKNGKKIPRTPEEIIENNLLLRAIKRMSAMRLRALKKEQEDESGANALKGKEKEREKAEKKEREKAEKKEMKAKEKKAKDEVREKAKDEVREKKKVGRPKLPPVTPIDYEEGVLMMEWTPDAEEATDDTKA